jgi:signal transduction histidine kinase
MSQLQPESRFDLVAPIVPKNGRSNGQVDQQLERMVAELELLCSAIQRHIQDLNQPLTVILGLSELLLAGVEADSPLATDLRVMVKQAGRMSQTINVVNDLIDQKNRVWRQLGYSRLGSPSQDSAKLTTLTEGGVEK